MGRAFEGEIVNILGDLRITDGYPGHTDNGLIVRPIQPTSAFGEISVAQNEPVWQTDFVYPVLSPYKVRTITQVSGSTSLSSGMVTCNSGDTALGLASVSSNRPLKYHAGQGAMTRFTAKFSTPNLGSVQAVGLSNGETGLLVGYRFNTNFMIWRQTGGAREVKTLTVVSGSANTENITITLEGVPTTVAVTNVGGANPTRTAWEIAQGVYSTVNSVGWDAFAEGSNVVFVRKQANAISGSFAVSSTSISATWTTSISGSAVSNYDVVQSNFSVDPLDGTGPSGMTIDPTKGNVFQIDFQYLGFGEIRFWVEGPDGQFVLFHEIRYANANTVPSLTNPNITWSCSAYNFVGTSTYACNLSTASASLYTQGPQLKPSTIVSTTAAKSSVAASRTPIVSIKLKQLYGNRLLLGEAIIRAFSVGVTGTKPAVAELVLNGTLNNTANFQSVNANSVMLTDTAATSISGGTTIAAFTLGKDGNVVRDMTTSGDVSITRFDTISIVVTPSAANTDVSATLSWFEDP